MSEFTCCKRYIIYKTESSLYSPPVCSPVCIESDGYVARYLLDKFNGKLNDKNIINNDGTE